MKKTLLLSVLASTMIMAGGDIAPVEPMVETPSADETPFSMPMGISLLGGVTRDTETHDEWDPVYGAEFSFPCLISDDIRQQIQFTYTENKDDGIPDNKMMQLSVNPHYIFNRGDTVEFGAGPHLGLARVELADEDDTIFTYGLGVSLKTDISGDFFVGVDARYEWTTDAEFNGIEGNFNNAKVFAKIGYQF